METVLNIGLNDQSVRGLAAQAESERFAFDSYRRLIQMFGKTVLGIDGAHFEDAIDAAKQAKGATNDLELDAEDLRRLVETFEEDVVAGIRNTVPLAELEQIDKRCYDELLENMRTLEEHYLDLCDIEFTIERGKLWMLQTRVGKRTAAAAFRIALQLTDQGLID